MLGNYANLYFYYVSPRCDQLPLAWRQRAEQLRDWGGGDDAARLWERAAVELEQALAAAGNDTVTLTEAARLTGLTAAHLGDQVRAGKIPNAGRKGRPRIRRTDLPAVKHPVPEHPPRRAVISPSERTSIIRRRRSH